MPKTYAQILADASSYAQDSGNAIFTTTELGLVIPNVLSRISRFSPWRPNEIDSRASSSQSITAKDIILTSGDLWRLMRVNKVEYPIDQNPLVFRSFSRNGKVVTMDIDATPSGTVYLYLAKVHILQSAIGTTDTAGAIKTGASAGAVSLALKSLGTGTINEDTQLTIAGDSTVYHVISTATIGTNEATVSIWPALQADVLADAVVTLALSESTLSYELEDIVVRYIAARAALSKSVLIYQQAHTAITSMTTAATAISGVAAIVTAARGYTTTGLVEAAKVSGILDTANLELDKIGAQITLAITAVAAGKTEADKMAAAITAAGTAVSGVAARVTQAITDLGSARTAIGLGVTAIPLANAQFDLMDTQIDLGIAALAEGEPLVNTVPDAGGAGEFMNQASGDFSAAEEMGSSGKVYLQEANADVVIANADLNLANGEVNAGLAKVREAQANLSISNADAAANRAQAESALGDIRNAQEYFREAQGYINETTARLNTNNGYLNACSRELQAANVKLQEGNASMSKGRVEIAITQTGRYYENWGQRELVKCEQELETIARSEQRPTDTLSRY
jgi:hypothetical protein